MTFQIPKDARAKIGALVSSLKWMRHLPKDQKIKLDKLSMRDLHKLLDEKYNEFLQEKNVDK